MLRYTFFNTLFVTISLLLVFSGAVAKAQKIYTIQPGDNILEQVPKEEWYEYTQFQKGAVYFRNGVNSTYSLNYNYLFGETLEEEEILRLEKMEI